MHSSTWGFQIFLNQLITLKSYYERLIVAGTFAGNYPFKLEIFLNVI